MKRRGAVKLRYEIVIKTIIIVIDGVDGGGAKWLLYGYKTIWNDDGKYEVCETVMMVMMDGMMDEWWMWNYNKNEIIMMQ